MAMSQERLVVYPNIRPVYPVAYVINPNFPPVGFVLNHAQPRFNPFLLHQLLIEEGLVPSEEEEIKMRNVIQKLKGVNPVAYVINPKFPPVGFVLNHAQSRFNPFLAQLELQRSISLHQLVIEEGLVPSEEEEIKRRNVIQKLKEIVLHWVKGIAELRLPHGQNRSASATILTYGSYGLGVYDAESDIDAICVGPYFCTSDDFFSSLRSMLEGAGVSGIQCVKDAKVPLMRFKFEGISIDLPYAQLKLNCILEDVDILNDALLRVADETSLKSLSGVRANRSILQLVPNVEIFQMLLRCVKFWAKRRGVYGNLFGYFGGIHLAVLVAYICQKYPNASLAALVSFFFWTFASWPWKTPVVLQDIMGQTIDPPGTRSLMSIQLPPSRHEYCHTNIIRSTFNKIEAELCRGFLLTQGLLRPNFQWRCLFEPFPYLKTYPYFFKVSLSASDQDHLRDWVGWVKSRFRHLLLKMDVVLGSCDPIPWEYVDAEIQGPSVVFYIGLLPDNTTRWCPDSVAENFKKIVYDGYQHPDGQIWITVIRADQFPKNDQPSGTQRNA